MKVASISVAAQHPRGLDLHLRNLRWALGDHTAYVFTFKGWNFDKSGYGAVQFIEADGDPLQFHHFWDLEIADFFRSASEDVFVLSELDMFFHRRVEDIPALCHSTRGVVLDAAGYLDSISGLLRGGTEVYPRLWENACFISRDVILRAQENGVGFQAEVRNARVLDALQRPDMLDLYLRTRTGKMARLASLGRSGPFKADHLYEFTLFCFLSGIPARKEDMIAHIPKPETFHRLVPSAYGSTDGAGALLDFFRARSDIRHLPGTLFMYYLSGVMDIDDTVRRLWKSDTALISKLAKIESTCGEWMSAEQYERFCRAQRIIAGVPLML